MKRSRVGLTIGARLHNDSGQVVHAQVVPVSKQCKLVPAKVVAQKSTPHDELAMTSPISAVSQRMPACG